MIKNIQVDISKLYVIGLVNVHRNDDKPASFSISCLIPNCNANGNANNALDNQIRQTNLITRFNLDIVWARKG